MSSSEINSRDYWEGRFLENWDAAGGPEQTRFFAETALRLMPSWLVRELRVPGRSFLDVGCAEGEAAAWFKREFPGLDAAGVDFSAAAIEIARNRHLGLTFEVADIRGSLPEADIVFCSNVLEHFHDPGVVLGRLAEAAKRHLVVVVPGWELQRHHEHHVTFFLDSFPFAQSDLALTHVQAINCARIDPQQWPGYQILVVYSKLEAIVQSGPTAVDFVRAGAMPGLSGDDLRDLSMHEEVFRTLGSVGADCVLNASIASVDAAVQALAQRQEAIVYNSRVEILQALEGVAVATRDGFHAQADDRDRDRQRFEAYTTHLEERLRQAEGGLAVAHDQRRDLESRLVAEIERRVASESACTAALEDVEFSRRRVSELQADLHAVESELALSRQRGAELQADLHAAESELALSRQRGAELETALHGAESELALSRQRGAELQADLHAAESELALSRQRVTELEVDLHGAKSELVFSRQRGGDLESSLQLMEQELASSKELAASVTVELREIEVRLAATTRSVGYLRALLNEKDSEMKRIEKAVEDLSTQFGVIAHELERQGYERSMDISRLRSECAGLQAAIAILEEDRARFVALAGRYRDHLLAVHSSASWRATSPLRGLKSIVTGSDAAAPIEFLPSPLVVVPSTLAPPIESVSAMQFPEIPKFVCVDTDPWEPLGRDISWEEFNERVLERRDQYRGVYIQELVIDWNVPLYQRPQHIASAMARLGCLVIYRTDNWGGDDVNGFREVAKNVWITNSTMTDAIEGAVRSIYSTAYAHQPGAFETRPKSSVLVYEYIDHIDPQISGEPENIARLVAMKDWAFGGGVDVIVASAKVLEAEAIAAAGSDNVILVQNGVDTRHYRSPAQGSVAVPESLVEFRGRYRTIVGYFGAIAPWLWYDAVRELVENRPDLGFVFIGPDYYRGVDRLPTDDNVLYMGTVDYKVLPGHARFFDVCFIPFEPGEIAKTTSPLKLFEYFALEKPVVVTSDMLECVAHAEVFHGRSATEFSDAIDAAVAVKDDESFKRRLAQLADENDWDRRAEAFARAFDVLKAKAQGAV